LQINRSIFIVVQLDQISIPTIMRTKVVVTGSRRKQSVTGDVKNKNNFAQNT